MHVVIGKEVDEEKTTEKVRHFLLYDLPKLASLADRDLTSLSSPQISFESSHGSPKMKDDTIVDKFAADKALTAIHVAAHHIPKEDHKRDIFILTYFGHCSEYELINKFMISISTLRRRKNKSLIEFARRLDVQKHKPQHNCDWLDSLIVYKKLNCK